MQYNLPDYLQSKEHISKVPTRSDHSYVTTQTTPLATNCKQQHTRDVAAHLRQESLVGSEQQVQPTWFVVDVYGGHIGQEVIAGLQQ